MHQRPLTRRSFLRTATLCAAASAGAGAFAASAGAATPRRIVVGAHPWVYAARQPNYELTPLLPQIFADLKQAGVDGIELMHTALKPDDAVARIGELSRRHHLPVLGTSFGGAMWDRAQHGSILEYAELVITRLAQLGGRTFGASVGPLRPATPRPLKTPEQLDAQAECLKKIIAFASNHGVTVNLHNHTYEVENNLHDLSGTLERIPDVKLGPDLNWLIRGGVDPVAFLRRFGSQIVFLHLRDQGADGRWVESIGEGVTDFRAIGAALREINFAGDAMIELAHERDFQPTRPLGESIRLSREHVRATMGI